MKLAGSGSRGVFFRANVRGTQETRGKDGGRIRGDWWIRWACPHGHLHRALVGPKSLATQEVQRKRLVHPCPARQRKPESYLLRDLIAGYLETAKKTKRSWKNDERYGKVWSERFGGRALEDVTTADLERIRTARLSATVRGKGRHAVTPATVNREFAFLKHLFNVAVRDGKTEKNPVARLKMLREPSGRVRYLSDEEETRLMATLATEEDRQRVTVLLQTGLRKAEFLGLRWRDVDFKAGVVSIPRSKNGEARHVPMTSTVRTLLAGRARSLDREALVFPNAEGKRDLRWAEKAIPEALDAARIEDCRLHDLRHTFASRLAMAGVDLLTVKELGGWKSLTMVQRYAHLSPSHRREAIERLAVRQPEALQVIATGTE